MRKLAFAVVLAVLLSGCGLFQTLTNQVTTGTSNGIATPSPGQWVCYHCLGVSVGSNGSFTFPNSSGAVGYIYTGPSGNPKTITLTYTVSGTGTVLPSPASGYGDAQVRLFLWRKGDDMTCSATTEWYREWSQSGVGPLTPGQHTISASVSNSVWTDCLGKSDSNQLAAVAANLVGIGFTFGAEFYGHGVYSTGQNGFSVDSLTVTYGS